MANIVPQNKPTVIPSVSNTATGGVPGGEMDALLLGRTRELAVGSPNERNWRGIFIALLVIVAVLGLIVFSIVLVSPPEEGPRNKGVKPTLEDIFLKLPPPAKFNGTWITDSEFIYRDENGGVTLYNADNLTTKILMTNSTFRQYDAVDYIISNNLKFVLLISELKRIHKYTSVARYHIYDIQTRLRKPLSPKELDTEAPFLQYVTWSPDGAGVAFVFKNDIYYKPRIDKDLVCRITTSGIAHTIYNGVPDWLYENEILHTDHTLWFSPDNLYLLYATFNDTLVGEYQYPWYNTMNNKIYSEVQKFRYPMVDTDNPQVTMWIVNLTMPKYLFPTELKPTNSVDKENYLTSASFIGKNNVAIIWLNRYQNNSIILTCKSKNNFNCTNFHIEREHIGWSERIFHPVFSFNGVQALLRLPVKDGENGHYLHICYVCDDLVIPLTHGPFEIIRILGWDEEKNTIYAIATIEDSPDKRHLFKIGDNNSTLPWTCMTCTPKIDNNTTYYFGDYFNETILNNSLLGYYVCDYNNVIFSKSYKYYIQECLGPDIPVLFLVETSTNNRLAILDSSNKLRKKVSSLSEPQIKTISVEIEYGYKAQVRLYLPPVLREYEEVTFPLILLVDASPSSQQVTSKWELSWPWYLASKRSYIVAKIDARGSNYQGIKMRRELFRKIGSVEVQDQIAVLTYLRDTFKFIDKNKICTVGKGYGGYVTTMMVLQDFHQVINCTISISPITNWRYYSSYFTEKYLGSPSRNLQCYENADLTIRAGNLDQRNYLLIYGTADTIIPTQHSLLFIKALIEQEVLFQQIAYPDEGHDFNTPALIHMYNQIDQFFNDSFGPSLDEWSDETTSFFIQ